MTRTPKLLVVAIALALALAALAACGGGGKSATATTTPAPATGESPAASGPIGHPYLGLAEITVFQGKDAMLKIHADGAIELGDRTPQGISYKPGPTIQADGTFVYQGKAVGRVDQDGTVHNLESGATAKFDFGDDFISVPAGPDQKVTLRLGPDLVVKLEGMPQKGEPIHVEGAKDVAARRTVLVVMASLLLGDVKTEPSSPPDVPDRAALPPPASTAPPKSK